ncbi:MAG TPA: 50S ribosomal protein L7Ae-like protein [Firmicutes bacterium]|nr:50S ribosomal protein L7Ae-like protein [Bacillota bacterium]HHY98695.1 50S ribosomal protein L7Ae-like protein [Bacillota bacterium]
MAYEELKMAKRRTVGTRETIKALERGEVKVLYLASDAEEHVVRDLKALSAAKGVPVRYANTMQELGKACGIGVGAAAAAVLDS